MKYYGDAIFSAVFPIRETSHILNLLSPSCSGFVDEDDFREAVSDEDEGVRTYLWLVHMDGPRIVAPILRNPSADPLFENSFRFFVPGSFGAYVNALDYRYLPPICPADIGRALDITIPFKCRRTINGLYNLSCRVCLHIVDRIEQMRNDELWRKARQRDVMSCFKEEDDL